MKAIEQNIESEIAQAVMEEQPMQPPAPKRKKRLTRVRRPRSSLSADAGDDRRYRRRCAGRGVLYSTDVYVTSETAFKQELFSNIAWETGRRLPIS